MIEEAIVKEIQNDATLSALITENGFLNVYPVRIPDNSNVTKAIIYNVITENKVYPNLYIPFLQFNCYADSYDDAVSLANELRRIFGQKGEYKLGGTFAVKFMDFENAFTDFDGNANKFVSIVEIKFKY